MFGLDTDTLRNIKGYFAQLPNIEKVLIYGSRAKGNYRNGSDIDITLIGANLSLNNSVYPLMEVLEDSYIPYEFDISIFNQLDNPDFISHILRIGKTFYQKENTSLPNGWEYGTLADAVDKNSSNISLNKVKDDNGEYPLFSAKGFNKNISFFHQEKEYLAIIKDGAGIGRVSQHPAKSSVVATMQYLIPKENFDIGFIQYFLNGIDFEKHRQGSTIPHVDFKDYKSEPFPLLPLPQQKKIVSILDKVFAAIATAKANAEQNLQNAKELFESYLQDVFENKGEDWEEKRFDEICVLQRGFDLPTRLRKEGKYPLVSSNGITDSVDIWKVKSPGVSTERSGTIGNIHYIEEDYFPLNTSLFIKEFHGNDEKFIYYFLKKFDLARFQSGAGVPTLNRNNVHPIKVYFLISKEEQKKIVQKLDALSTQTKKLELIYRQKIANLEELKKSVLQKAFSGQLLVVND